MRRGILLGVGGALIAGLGSASPAVAQDRPMYELPAIQVTVMEDGLNQRAIELYEFPERWAEAGDLHRQAAESLLKNDARQYWAFSRAALLYFYADEFAQARKSMEKAAQVAVATGDVLTAAHAYVDAAFIAIAEGFPGKKREFVRDASRLAGSELLTAEQRSGVVARIEGAPQGRTAARVAVAKRLGLMAALDVAAD